MERALNWRLSIVINEYFAYDGCMKRRTLLQMGLLALAGCATPPVVGTLPDSYFEGTPTRYPTRPGIPPGECHPAAWVAPTRPAALPGPDQLDDVGLHVVNAARAPQLDLPGYRLKISGKVESPLELTLDELRCMPNMTETVNLTCKGYFEDVTRYTGVPLPHLLRLAGLKDGLSGVNLVGADGSSASLTLGEALGADNFIAYQWKDQPIPIYHGFPVRAVLPALLGYAWTKFLVEIVVS